MTDKAREEFELALNSYMLGFADLTVDDAGDYVDVATLGAWWGWQASRAALVVELPHSWETYCGSTEEFVMYANDVEDMVKSAGLKAAP